MKKAKIKQTNKNAYFRLFSLGSEKCILVFLSHPSNPLISRHSLYSSLITLNFWNPRRWGSMHSHSKATCNSTSLYPTWEKSSENEHEHYGHFLADYFHHDSHLFTYSICKKYFNIFKFMVVLGISDQFSVFPSTVCYFLAQSLTWFRNLFLLLRFITTF